jgi:hypothetical protein
MKAITALSVGTLIGATVVILPDSMSGIQARIDSKSTQRSGHWPCEPAPATMHRNSPAGRRRVLLPES